MFVNFNFRRETLHVLWVKKEEESPCSSIRGKGKVRILEHTQDIPLLLVKVFLQGKLIS
jgi:hypothetical protein